MESIIFILGKAYRIIIQFPISLLFNLYYLIKYKRLSYFKRNLNISIKYKVKSVNDAIDFTKNILGEYKNDPLKGTLDWQSNPVVQYMRSFKEEIKHSNDCDDFSNFLKYILKQKPWYQNVQVVSAVSKKPFFTSTHSFVIANLKIKPYKKQIAVFAPYKFLGIVKSKKEAIALIEEYYDNKIIFYKAIF